MNNVERRDPADDNPVSSFEVGITALKGTWIATCIKFSMYDRSTMLTHWSPKALDALMRAINEYCEHLGMNAFMFRAKDEPALVNDLPARHPYHTLLSEVPTLTEDEVGSANLKTGINEVTFAIRGPTMEMRPVFGDGHAKSIFIHEYTALSLFGYLREYLDAARKLTGAAAGSA